MWLAVDEDGLEFVYKKRPTRVKDCWGCESNMAYVQAPEGTIKRLLDYPLTWEDDCQEIVEYKDNTTLNDDDIIRILKASEDQPREYLKQKIVNLHDQLNKNRKTVQNQKEEITRLLAYKERLQQMLMMPCKSVDNNNLVKLLEEKDAIIKYLENKLEI